MLLYFVQLSDQINAKEITRRKLHIGTVHVE